jgi:hypothetical protein
MAPAGGVAFLMRPAAGGWLMGIFADRYGRKSALTIPIPLMCLGSLIIVVLPGYAIIGILAPALLVIARLIRGISMAAATQQQGIDAHCGGKSFHPHELSVLGFSWPVHGVQSQYLVDGQGWIDRLSARQNISRCGSRASGRTPFLLVCHGLHLQFSAGLRAHAGHAG